MNWIELAKEAPPIGHMGQTDHLLVAYYPGPDTHLIRTIAFCDKDGKGSGWLEARTFYPIPAPRYWMPLPSLP